MGIYEIKKNKEYKDKIENGEYELFSIADGSWNYYINKNNYIFYVAKDDSSASGLFSDLKYYFNLYMNENYKYHKLTKKGHELILNMIEKHPYYKRNKTAIINKIILA